MLLKLPPRILANSMCISRSFLALFTLLGATCLYGQFDSGAVLGTVHDPTGASIANAASQFGAAYLARRIGLINTMVFTHIPANLSLVAVAFAPNFTVAAALYLLRELMIQMDVPTRQSYVMAVVRPEERTFASGVTHLVRLGGWAIAPAFAGLIMQGVSLGAPLVAGSLLKVLYDILLYVSFRHLRPPEELENNVSENKEH